MWNRLPIPGNSDIGNVRVISKCDVFVLVLLQENATISSVCIVELHVCQQYENIESCTAVRFFGEFASPVKIKRSTYLHVKWPTSLSGFNLFRMSRQISVKGPSMKFHRNPSSGSRAGTCGQTDRTDGQTMTQLSEHTDWLYPCSRVRGKLIVLS